MLLEKRKPLTTCSGSSLICICLVLREQKAFSFDLTNYPTEFGGREGKSALPAFKLIYLFDFLIKRESLFELVYSDTASHVS